MAGIVTIINDQLKMRFDANYSFKTGKSSFALKKCYYFKGILNSANQVHL